MSMLSDIQSTLTKRTLRDILSVDERAQLLIDITNDLEWDIYLDNNNKVDFESAKSDILRSDREWKRIGK